MFDATNNSQNCFTAAALVDIALQAGENLVSVAAGDTARWVIGGIPSGSGAARRP